MNKSVHGKIFANFKVLIVTYVALVPHWSVNEWFVDISGPIQQVACCTMTSLFGCVTLMVELPPLGIKNDFLPLETFLQGLKTFLFQMAFDM